jgi:hypothetical protein
MLCDEQRTPAGESKLSILHFHLHLHSDRSEQEQVKD